MDMTSSDSILQIPSEHVPGVVALVILCVTAVIAVTALRTLAGRHRRTAIRLRERLDAIGSSGRIALFALLAGAVVHVAIIPTHWGDERTLAYLFALDGAGLLGSAVLLVAAHGSRSSARQPSPQQPSPGDVSSADGSGFVRRTCERCWRAGSIAMLTGTAVAYVLYLIEGWEEADPVGLAITAMELVGAMSILSSRPASAATHPTARSIARAIPATSAILAVTLLLAGSLSAATATAAGDTNSTGAMAMTGQAGDTPGAPSTAPGGTASSSAMDMAGSPGDTPGAAPTAPGGTAPSTSMSMAGPMAGPSGTGGTGGTMPPMGNPPAGAPSDGDGMTMGGPGGGNPGTGTISLPTDSPAGAITWPVPMGQMEGGMKMVNPNCDTTPTAAQQQAAVQLVDATTAALARFTSLDASKAAGYTAITPPNGSVVHYVKAGYLNDDKELDPNAIESLVYANTTSGPVLVAAMYVVPYGQEPPTPGGCLTQYHVHTNLCFSEATHTIVGTTDRSGACKPGDTNRTTRPMIHVWVAPIPGGPLAVDASRAQILSAAEHLG